MSEFVGRFLAWHVRTYGRWAYQHEPFSFAIYPLVTALGPAIVWLAVGLRPALWFLGFTEAFTISWLAVGLRQRRRRSVSTQSNRLGRRF